MRGSKAQRVSFRGNSAAAPAGAGTVTHERPPADTQRVEEVLARQLHRRMGGLINQRLVTREACRSLPVTRGLHAGSRWTFLHARAPARIGEQTPN